MFFKKSVKKATKKFRSIRSDLTAVIGQECRVQRELSLERATLAKRLATSQNEMDEAQAILSNVNQFLGSGK